jgi:hypothetical protein
MRTLAADPNRRQQLAQAATERAARHFSLTAIGEAYHALLTHVATIPAGQDGVRASCSSGGCPRN